MGSQHETSIDRRLFLGATGTLTLLGQPALAQKPKGEAKPDSKADAVAKRLSDTIADFVAGFDPNAMTREIQLAPGTMFDLKHCYACVRYVRKQPP